MRRKSPITIQQWVDSLPIPSTQHSNSDKTLSPDTTMSTTTSGTDHNSDPDTISKTSSTPSKENPIVSSSINFRGVLSRDASFQSDDASSHCSSVESVLEFRRPDPEEVLIGLGFGPSCEEDETARIPKRFLHPSKLAGVSVERFLQKRDAKDATSSFYWPPNMHSSSLNLGQDFKDIPYTKDSTNFNPSS